MKNTLVEECVKYFKSNVGFKRALESMRKKYLSLGTIGGTIVLQKLTSVEKLALSGLLRKDFHKNSSATIKLSDFQKALDRTKFKGVLIDDVLKAYFSEELVSNFDTKQLYENTRINFFQKIISNFDTTNGANWLNSCLQNKTFGYNTLLQRYDSNMSKLEIDLNKVCLALNNLPYLSDTKLSLPVFASRISSNPHELDEGTSTGQLFMHALSHHFSQAKPINASERAELLYKAGILIDEVSNWVLTCGLIAYDSNNELHAGWKGFYDMYEPVQITLLNLSKLTKIVCPTKKVFVVENPAVFASLHSTIMEKLSQRNSDLTSRLTQSELPALVCTYGQVNLAGLVLLDLLSSSESQLMYSGDFDPEGLLIADKLKLRYGNKLTLWHYSIEDYKSALSNCPTTLQRMKQVETLKTPELIAIAKSISNVGYCGYQELLLDDLISDIETQGDGSVVLIDVLN